jgi:hypothetical protein
MSAIIYSHEPLLRAITRRFDSRSLRVGVLLMALAILNGVDLIYTVFAQQIDQLEEVNPVVAALLHLGGGGVGMVVAFKVVLVSGSLGLLWKFRHNRLTVAACWLLMVAYVSLGVVWIVWANAVNSTFEMQLSSAFP